jgi:hypothetical protein
MSVMVTPLNLRPPWPGSPAATVARALRTLPAGRRAPLPRLERKGGAIPASLRQLRHRVRKHQLASVTPGSSFPPYRRHVARSDSSDLGTPHIKTSSHSHSVGRASSSCTARWLWRPFSPADHSRPLPEPTSHLVLRPLQKEAAEHPSSSMKGSNSGYFKIFFLAARAQFAQSLTASLASKHSARISTTICSARASIYLSSTKHSVLRSNLVSR